MQRFTRCPTDRKTAGDTDPHHHPGRPGTDGLHPRNRRGGADRFRPAGAKPVTEGHRGGTAQAAVYLFSFLPMLAVVLAVPFAWGWGLGWRDIAIAAVFYVISGMGITVGFHRYFTHGSFKATAV